MDPFAFVNNSLLESPMTPKNLDQVYKVFAKNYVTVPLEIFHTNPYKTLISTLLSSRTNDATTLKVCQEKLFPKANDFGKLSKLSEKQLAQLIYPVGFYKTKTKHLKQLAKIILTKFDGKIPQTREELITLPGVGRKTANLVLNRAFGVPAIAVDTHVHRISNLLGWVKTNKPEETERKLIKILPQSYWKDMNRFFVSVGRQYRSERQLKEFLTQNGLTKED